MTSRSFFLFLFPTPRHKSLRPESGCRGSPRIRAHRIHGGEVEKLIELPLFEAREQLLEVPSLLEQEIHPSWIWSRMVGEMETWVNMGKTGSIENRVDRVLLDTLVHGHMDDLRSPRGWIEVDLWGAHRGLDFSALFFVPPFFSSPGSAPGYGSTPT